MVSDVVPNRLKLKRKMRNNIIISSLLIVILSMTVACSNEDTIIKNSLGDELNSVNNKAVTLSGATMDGVSVLIFGRNENAFKYQRSISTGWSVDGKVSTLLEIGMYKFLFLKYKEENTIFYPKPLDTNSTFESIKIEAKDDPDNIGYLLPVDEIWLPETEGLANKQYLIDNPTTIFNRLERAVSQVQVNIRRGYKSGENILPLPFPEGKDITENIKEIIMDIDGVGESITISGGSGSSKTIYTAESAAEITDDGYAIFEGPLVFPNGSGENTSVNLTIVPKDGSLYPTMKANAAGLLERNKKLEITLWLTSTYKLINVTVRTEPISLSEDGDEGIWE